MNSKFIHILIFLILAFHCRKMTDSHIRKTPDGGYRKFESSKKENFDVHTKFDKDWNVLRKEVFFRTPYFEDHSRESKDELVITYLEENGKYHLSIILLMLSNESSILYHLNNKGQFYTKSINVSPNNSVEYSRSIDFESNQKKVSDYVYIFDTSNKKPKIKSKMITNEFCQSEDKIEFICNDKNFEIMEYYLKKIE
ncbi:hypothetical protein [Leptospira soteropolitanensis]|nr:hypothetical protein [Leptospira soteropolitanensis]MCW7492550.1 hypothetical protein [Leptospira soteropolitanensis]